MLRYHPIPPGLGNKPGPVGMEITGTADQFICVCTKIVPLCLDKVGWHPAAPDSVEIT